MKIRADEHVSEEIVRAVCEISLTSRAELTHVNSVGDRGAKDTHWITRFGKQDGDAILTADSDFLKRPHQVMAVYDAGLKIIHLPPRWANARCDLQASHILLWWRRIETELSDMKPRECCRLPWNLKETGKLKRIPVDYEKARKKLKKAARRSE